MRMAIYGFRSTQFSSINLVWFLIELWCEKLFTFENVKTRPSMRGSMGNFMETYFDGGFDRDLKLNLTRLVMRPVMGAVGVAFEV